MWQVQIWVEEVGEWFGWAHTEYDATSKRDAEKAARTACRYGWTTRVVRAHCEDD